MPKEYISIVYRGKKVNKALANKQAKRNKIKLIVRKRGGL